MLKGIKKYYEEFHRVTVNDAVLAFAVRLSERYITDRFLPDKAIDMLDEACSCAALDNPALNRYDRIKKALQKNEQELAELKLHGLVVVAEEHVALGDEITFLNVRLQYLFVALFDRCRFSGNDKAGIPVHQPYRTL